jgi:ATP-binding cassette subfamily B protein
VDKSDGQPFGASGRGPYFPDRVAPSSGESAGAAGPIPIGPVTAGAAEPEVNARIQAVIIAARFYGIELDPGEFRAEPGEKTPGAAALSAWAQGAGMWARAVRLRWRQLMRLQDAGPVVLLFTDGTAGLLTGVNADQNIVLVKDPCAPASKPAVAVDELRLRQVWSGEAVLLRAERGTPEAEAPFTLGWLAGLVMKERKSLRDIAYASLTLSFLTIFPPLLVMTVVDKVLTHHSYSTLALLGSILLIGVVYESLLGYARRLIVVVVGIRLDARLNLTCSTGCCVCRSIISSDIRPARRCTRSAKCTRSATSLLGSC